MTVPGQVRTRIAPAPSGDLHVGNVRTALFSWAFARRHGGRFLLRVEDTDASRATDEAFAATQEILRWVGLDWDEGPGVGGPYAPYRQSERRAIYDQAVAQLEASGDAYRAYSTAEELAARKAAAVAAGGKPTPGYDGFDRDLTDEQRARYEAEDRPYVVRFRMPPGRTTFTDLVRGDITIEHAQIPDFALTRSDGSPLYVLAAAVDDMAMHLTHIVRGEDLLAATPRQLALYAALGHPPTSWPQFGHLPLIVASDGKPLSKRNGEVSLRWYRDHGFLPAALLNYLALLGWSLAPDRELFSVEEMVAAFDLGKVSHNPARFDIKKLEAINGEKIRALPELELGAALLPWLEGSGLQVDRSILQRAVPLVQSRMVRLSEAPDLLGFLFVAEEDFRIVDEQSLVDEMAPALDSAIHALQAVQSWSTPEIEQTLRTALVDGLGLKPRHAFGPIRLAVSGRRISPPLFESIELLGRSRTLERLAGALAKVRPS